MSNSTGAFHTSWAGANPREKFQAFIKANGGDEDAALAASQDFFQSNEGKAYLPALIEYAFTNAFRSYTLFSKPRPAPIVVKPEVKPEVKLAREADKAAIEVKVAEATIKVVQGLQLLSLILPNGKRLCDCSGEELVEMGGWLADIGRRVLRMGRPTVGTSFTETELRKSFAVHLAK